MSFEIIIIPFSWFNSHNYDNFNNLKSLVNKSYDKPRYKYGIIKSSRLNKHHNVLDDLAIKPKDKFNLYLLLIKREKFTQLQLNRQFVGDIDQCYNCDIPNSFNMQISDISYSNIILADDSFEFDSDILSRCVGSVGLKSYKSDPIPRTAQLELTCFTSFMRNLGPSYLNHVLNLIKSNKEYFRFLLHQDKSQFDTLIVHADCIVEHDLVDFYINKCNFKQSGRPNLKITVNTETGSAGGFGVLEDGIMASKDFHLGFLKRIIEL